MSLSFDEPSGVGEVSRSIPLSHDKGGNGLPNPPKPGSADHWSIVVSFPSGRVRYVRSLFRLAELLGEVEQERTPREKRARAKERRTGMPPKEALDEVDAILEKREWQRRFLAAEAAAHPRPFQRLNLPTDW